MFDRPHHLRVAAVLGSLSAERLERHRCWFGGGTAVVLRYGEYLESLDIDFMVSDLAAYRELRRAVVESRGVQCLTRPGATLRQLREVRADAYGLRTMLDVGGTPLKFEIISEGRIDFDDPGPSDRVCGVATLTALDLAASKLLANSDRWADDAVLSRDVIDLAMMSLPAPTYAAAVAKANGAYPDVEREVIQAVDMLESRPGRLDQCARTLMMTMPKAVLWRQLKTLRRRARGSRSN